MKQVTRIVWIAFVGATTGAGQAQTTSIVVPAAYAKTEAPNTAFWAFSPFNARRQLILDESHLPGLRGKKIRSIWVRRNSGDLSQLASRKVKIKIELSHALLPAAKASERFETNRGKDKTKVFDADIQTPVSAAPKDVPVTWQTPHTIELKFKDPFLYRGGPLCIETITEKRDKDLWWPVDAVASDSGKVTQFGRSCIPNAGANPAGADRAGAVPGSTCTLFFRGMTAEDDAFCHIGTSDRYWNSLPLPFDLGPIGAPGCSIHVEMLFNTPIKLQEFKDSKIRHGSVSGTIPLSSAVVGMTIFSQWSIKAKNALMRESSNGVRIEIGALPRLGGLIWIESPSTSADAGRVMRGRFPVLRIDANGP